jgi:hypothetical protein
MHRSFANWYSLVDLRADGPTLEARWNAVDAYARNLQREQVPDLVRMFYSRPCTSDSKDNLSKTAQGIDQAFLMDNNDIELSVLAAGVIAEVLAQPSDLADAMALAVVCMDAQGLRNVGRLQGPIDAAVEYLATESVRVRTGTDAVPPPIPSSGLVEIAALKAAVPQGDTNALQPLLGAALRSITSAISKYAELLQQQLTDLQLQHREESDILWWLFGEHTSDARPFAKLKVEEACLHGPADLADFTQLIPGPIGAPAFLKKMLRFVRPKLKSTLTSRYPVQDLADFCPLLFAASKSVEAGSGAWRDAFRNISGLEPDDGLPPGSLATQAYQEMILYRALN